jgi:hypothetical protein
MRAWQVRDMREQRAPLETRLAELRGQEGVLAAAADVLRAELGLAAPEQAPAAPSGEERKPVLGQATWEMAKERLATRAQVPVPRMVRPALCCDLQQHGAEEASA